MQISEFSVKNDGQKKKKKKKPTLIHLNKRSKEESEGFANTLFTSLALHTTPIKEKNIPKEK